MKNRCIPFLFGWICVCLFSTKFIVPWAHSVIHSFIHLFSAKSFCLFCVNFRMNCFATECNINSQRTNERIAHILIKTTFTRFISNSLENIIATVRRDKFLTIHSCATEMLKHSCIAKLVEIFISFEMRCYNNFRCWNLFLFFSSPESSNC